MSFAISKSGFPRKLRSIVSACAQDCLLGACTEQRKIFRLIFVFRQGTVYECHKSSYDPRSCQAVLEDINIEELSNRLMIEFTRLFRGIKRGYGLLPPYESIYRGERRVIGQVTLDVMRMYRDVGFVFNGDYAGPQDYLGVELKFMAFLCQSEMNAWKNNKDDKAKKYLELEKKFLTMHLLQIIPKFSRNVVQQTREKFYIGVVRLTERFTIMDADTIDFLLSNLSRNISTACP